MGDQGYMDAAAVPVPDAADDTLRRELAEAIWLAATGHLRQDESATVADALLPLIREHIAKAVLRHDARARADEIKRRTRTEAALRDIADHGLRADLNPTVTSAMDGGGTYRELTAYLRNLDSRLRKRAQAALDGSETP